MRQSGFPHHYRQRTSPAYRSGMLNGSTIRPSKGRNAGTLPAVAPLVQTEG
jgi:hypothetical protein